MNTTLSKYKFWLGAMLLVVMMMIMTPVFAQGGSDLAVTKSVDNATPYQGENIVYTIIVTNNGPDPATAVNVIDFLPSGVTYVSDDSAGAYNNLTGFWTVGSLANGASATLNITGTVAAVDGTTVFNSAIVFGAPDPNTGNNSAVAIFTVVNQADLGIDKIVDNSTPYFGSNVVYTLTATNAGPNDANSVSVTDLLPAGLTYVSDTGAGAYDSVSGIWTVGTITAGGSAALDITATVNAADGTIIANGAAITGAEVDNNALNDSTSIDVIVTNVADLGITKTVDNATPNTGSQVVYTLTAANSGPNDATAVSVSDLLPPGVTYASDDGGGAYDSVSGIWTIGALANGGSAALNITATVNAANGAIVTNGVSISGAEVDNNAANDSASVDITVTNIANLRVTKSVDNVTPNTGSNVMYTVTVENLGPNTATGVQVFDSLPGSVAYVSDDSGGQYNGLTWTVGAIPAFGSATLNITVTINGVEGEVIVNSALVSGSEIDPVPGNNTAAALLTVTNIADLAVTKTVDNATPNDGSLVVYTVTVTNNGPNDATNVTVADPLPAGVVYSADNGGGAYDNVSGTWTIGGLAAGSSVSLDITATVNAGDGAVVTNTAAVSGSESDPTAANDSASVDITVTNIADLGVTKTVDNATPNDGSSVVYTITVTNGGPNDATGVSVADSLPAGVTYVSDDSGGAYDSGTGMWTIGSLPAAGSAVLNITATVNAGEGAVVTNTATVTGAQIDPNTANNSANVGFTVTNIADLDVTKTVDNATPYNGGAIVYTITAANNGPNDATAVTVTDVLPTGVTWVSDDSGGAYSGGVWTIGNLANGGTAVLNITAAVSGPDGTLITNSASIVGTEIDPNAANDAASVDITITNVADLGVTKTVDNAAPQDGSAIVYTITATNSGPNDATAVSVTDVLPAGITYVSDDSGGAYSGGIWTIGSLPAGGTAVLNITAIANGPDGTLITNSASISGAEVDNNAANDSASVDITVVNVADLSVAKTVDNATPQTGDTIIYTVTAANNGPAAATNVSVTDVLPADVTYVSDNSGGAYSGGVWTIGSLAVGSSVSLDITVTVNGPHGDLITNSASIAGDQTDNNAANDSASVDVTVTNITDLSVAKTVDNAAPNTGSSVIYTITAVNNGPAAATGVSVADLLPAGVTYVSDDGLGAYNSASGTWTIGNLAAGGSMVLNITASVNAPHGSLITNSASISGNEVDPNAANDAASVDITVTNFADLAVTKTVDNAIPYSGSTIVYTLTATNNGPDAATGVVVSDPLPAGASHLGDDGGGAYNSGTGNWTIGSLAVGEIRVLNITAMVSAPDGTLITNNASISGNEVDTNAVNDAASVDITVTNVADLSVTKTVDDAMPFDGGSVTYTIVAGNSGPNDATAVTVTDLLPPGTTYASDDSLGAYNSVTGDWTIGSLPVGGTATLNITAVINPNTDGDTITNIASISGAEFDPDPANNTANAVSVVRVNDLCATTGTITLPSGPTTLPIWGYAPGDCTRGLPAQLPGPAIVAIEGETINLTLHNGLAEQTAMLFYSQDMPSDMVGAAPGGSTTYTFPAASPGTYLYEAGLLPNANHQVAMGMFGTLIVRPTTANQAYNSPATAYDDEAILVLSEIDPNLNNSLVPATFDLRDFNPTYRLINGKVYPQTDAIPTAAGNNVLLRIVNAGLQPHTMSLLGASQTLVGVDGNLTPYPRGLIAETLASGQTKDIIATIPGGAVPGSKFALYDGSLLLHNNNDAGYGGMMTFLTLAPGLPGGADIMGPTADTMAVSPSPTDGSTGVTLTAVVSDVDTGNANIVLAEYYIDDTTAPATAMLATDGAFDSPTEAVQAAVPPAALAGLQPGEHTLYVRGQDALGNWGDFNLVPFQLVNAGPLTYGLTFTPNPSRGDVDVVLSGTGDDSAEGNSIITAAEYFIDSAGPDGAGTPMSVNVPEPIASIDAAIPAATVAALSEGVHSVYVHSQDSFGHWGPLAIVELYVDKSGPDTSGVTVAPDPNNGSLPINPSLFSIRVDATINDPLTGASGSSLGVQSALWTAEFFIDYNPAVDVFGTGAPMYPRDGLFNTSNEDTYALLALINISALSEGIHTVDVHGRDASGNWGAIASANLLVDKTAPTVAGTAASPNPSGGAAVTTLTASASDTASNIVMAEWFAGVDPGPGNGAPMAVAFNGTDWDLSASIDLTGWAAGNHTLSVRAKDAAGNWSLADSVVLIVTTEVPFYGVTVTPPTAATPGNPGVTVSYILDVTNNGNVADTYDVIVNGNAWTTTAPATVGPLASGAMTQITVDVTIPAGALSGDSDTAIVTVTSQGDPGQSDASSLTTSAVLDQLYFSTVGAFAVPGVSGPYDDADVYNWDGTAFGRIFDASVAGLPNNADIDGLVVVDADTFYMSFNRNGGVNVPGIGVVQDEDIVLYDAGVWSLYFIGGDVGLKDTNGEDVDAFDILPDGSIILSAIASYNPDPDFPNNLQDEDVIRCVPNGGIPVINCTWSIYLDGSDVGLNNGGGEDVNGLAMSGADLYLTTLGAFSVTGLSGDGFDAFACNTFTSGTTSACTSFSMYFDGSVTGVTNQIDAIDLP